MVDKYFTPAHEKFIGADARTLHLLDKYNLREAFDIRWKELGFNCTDEYPERLGFTMWDFYPGCDPSIDEQERFLRRLIKCANRNGYLFSPMRAFEGNGFITFFFDLHPDFRIPDVKEPE